jgi:hypothetical protein
LAESPVLLKLVTLAPTVAICEKVVQLAPMQRSMLNPVSLLELSIQLRLIWLADTDVAFNPLGATGGKAGVVAPAILE